MVGWSPWRTTEELLLVPLIDRGARDQFKRITSHRRAAPAWACHIWIFTCRVDMVETIIRNKKNSIAELRNLHRRRWGATAFRHKASKSSTPPIIADRASRTWRSLSGWWGEVWTCMCECMCESCLTYPALTCAIQLNGDDADFVRIVRHFPINNNRKKCTNSKAKKNHSTDRHESLLVWREWRQFRSMFDSLPLRATNKESSHLFGSRVEVCRHKFLGPLTGQNI